MPPLLRSDLSPATAKDVLAQRRDGLGDSTAVGMSPVWSKSHTTEMSLWLHPRDEYRPCERWFLLDHWCGELIAFVLDQASLLVPEQIYEPPLARLEKTRVQSSGFRDW